jgi:hypothetical protein
MSQQPVRTIYTLVILVSLIVSGTLSAESPEESSKEFFFGLGLGIGVQNYPNPDYTGIDTEPEFITYQSLNLSPEFGWGKFGMGLSLTLNYRFTGGDSGDEFEVRKEDWEAGDVEEFLEVYLPKFSYVRYGQKGDPLYVKMGSLEDISLGNGFIVGNYSNTLYLPETRVFGMSFDLDGTLFSFPYLGMETFVANLARFDLMAGRIYARPWAGSSVPILDGFQLGAPVAADTDPAYFADKDANYPDALLPPSDASVLIYGIDFRLPLTQRDIFYLSVFGDGVVQKEGSGAMVGAGGRLARFITTAPQVRFLQDQFIPSSILALPTTCIVPSTYLYYYGQSIKKRESLVWFSRGICPAG